MKHNKKPWWWPKNPYPEDVFPMKREEYPQVVPDPHMRTALSGCLGREFWGIAEESIFDAMNAQRCEWTFTACHRFFKVKTSCGQAFEYNSYPKPDYIVYCTYCGAKIEEIGDDSKTD